MSVDVSRKILFVDDEKNVLSTKKLCT